MWKRWLGVSIVMVAMVVSAGCAKKPPILTPEANTAWNRTQVINSLDLVRDISITANEFGQAPFTPAATRAIVQGHQSTLFIMRSTQDGWEAVVNQSLDEVVKNVPKDVAARIDPYVSLTRALLRTILNRGIEEDSALVIELYKKTLESSLEVDARWLSSH